MKEVGSEKLEEAVANIMANEPYSGGAKKLIRRLYYKLTMSVDYAELDQARRVKTVSTALERRGHVLVPMRHGECIAGSNHKVKSAHCYSKSLDEIQRANASPSTCARCPYHLVSAGYLVGLKSMLDEIRADARMLVANTLQSAARIAAIVELERLVAEHSQRLEEVADQ
jgi:hypothetical protein